MRRARRCRRRPRVRRHARAPRHHRRSTRRSAPTAGAHAGLVDLATFNLINAVLAAPAARRPATGCWCTWRADYARSRSCAARDLIFFRQPRDRRREAAWPTWCTRRRCTTRTGWRAAASRACARWRGDVGSRRARRRRRACAAQLEERLGDARRDRRSAGAVALPDRIAAGPALLDTLAPLVGVLLRERRRDADAAHQSLDPPVLQRARVQLAARLRRARDRRRSTVVQRRARRARSRGTPRELPARHRRRRAARRRRCGREADARAARASTGRSSSASARRRARPTR